MQKEQIFQGEARQTQTTSPHFDEEWTVMSARPVVPLQELKPKSTGRTRLKLVGAFAAALILGALAALVTVGIQQPKNQATQATHDTQEPVIEGVVIEPEAPLVETAEQVEVIRPDPDIAGSEPVIVASTGQKHTETLAARIKSPTTHTEKPRSNEAVNDEQPLQVQIQIEPRQNEVDRFEERRLRRVLRRQRRERTNQRQGDLSRIDEIFEGRRSRP